MTEQHWEISARTLPTIVVEAPNWMIAVGLAMERLGVLGGMERVACERLPNGQIIINDISTGLRLTACPVLVGPQEAPFLDWMLDCISGFSYDVDPLASIH